MMASAVQVRRVARRAPHHVERSGIRKSRLARPPHRESTAQLDEFVDVIGSVDAKGRSKVSRPGQQKER